MVGDSPAATAAGAPTVTETEGPGFWGTLKDAFTNALRTHPILAPTMLAIDLASATSPEAIREHLGTLSAKDALNLIAEQDPRFKDIIASIQKHPELAEALHSAIVNDPTVLPGLQQLATAEGTEGLTLADVQKLLDDEGPTGQLARTRFTQALRDVADPSKDLDFAHLIAMGQQAKNLTNGFTDFSDILDRLQNDPDGLIRDLLQNSGLGDSQYGQMLAGFLKDIMLPLLQTALNPDNYRDISNYLSHYGEALRSSGSEVLTTPVSFEAPVADGIINRLPAGELREKFTAAMERVDGRRYDNPAHVRAALTEVDPDLADKFAAMDNTTSNAFNTAVTTGSTLEQVKASMEAFVQSLAGGATPSQAVATMNATPGG